MSSATASPPPERRPAISFAVNEIADINSKLSEITQRASPALTGVRTSFQLFSRPNRLRTVAASRGSAVGTEPAIFADDAGIAGWVATEQTALFLPDVTRDSRFLPLRGAAERGALLCLPLIDEGACYGALTARADSPSDFSPSVRGVLAIAARCAAMELTRFRQMATPDASSDPPVGRPDPDATPERGESSGLDREALQKQLHEEKQRFSAVISLLEEGILILDGPGTTILEANPAFYGLIGVSEREMHPPLTLHAMEGRWSLQESSPSADDPAMPRRWEIQPTAFPDRVLAVVDSPVSIGTVLHRVWIIHDVTAMSRIERTRSDFMRVVSHELRSPFASIYGYMSILAAEKAGPLTPMQRESLRVMRLSVRQLWRLIEDIIDLVQSDKDELVLEMERVDVIELVRSTATSIMPLLQANDVRCEIEIEAPIPAIYTDPVRFHQILTNLINNAMKFSDPGAVIAVRAHVADGDVLISVHDSGPGVAPEERERIFERFAKGQQTPHRDTSGLGIGLAVVRELVTMHGGRVWVESAPEGGSVFTFTLPIPPNEGNRIAPMA